MKIVPKSYQKRIRDHIVENGRSAIFAGLGLGKTVSTLLAIQMLFFLCKIRGVLIIAPIRVIKMTWPDEIKKWGFSRNMKVLNLRDILINPTNAKQRKRQAEAQKIWEEGGADIYLINFELIGKMCDKLFSGETNIPVDMMVIDEASAFKKPGGKRFRKLRKFLYHFKYRTALTGTPVPNSYLDLFGIFLALDDGERLDHRITVYQSKYFYNPDRRGFKWVLRDGAKEEIEGAIEDITLTLRSEDHLKIPDVVENIVEVPLSTEAKKMYKTLEKQLLIEVEGGEIPAVSAASLVNKLLQITSGVVYDEDGEERYIHDAKIEALKKLLPTLTGNTIVACAYKHEIPRIIESIKGAEVFDENRKDAWNNGEIPVWVTNYKSISHGLNLQAGGQNVVWFTPTYSYESDKQLNGRLARMGQEHITTINRLVCTDTIDEVVISALRAKEGGERGLMKALDMLQMFRS